MPTGDNWTKDHNVKEFRKKAIKVLEDLKKQRYKGKKTKLVKIKDFPPTYKEIIDEE